MEKYFTVDELAKYLNFSEKTVYKWVLNGEIPFFKINQTIRFRLSDIECWLEKSRKGAAVDNKKTSGGLFPADDVNTGDVKTAGDEEVKQNTAFEGSEVGNG